MSAFNATAVHFVPGSKVVPSIAHPIIEWIRTEMGQWVLLDALWLLAQTSLSNGDPLLAIVSNGFYERDDTTMRPIGTPRAPALITLQLNASDGTVKSWRRIGTFAGVVPQGAAQGRFITPTALMITSPVGLGPVVVPSTAASYPVGAGLTAVPGTVPSPTSPPPPSPSTPWITGGGTALLVLTPETSDVAQVIPLPGSGAAMPWVQPLPGVSHRLLFTGITTLGQAERAFTTKASSSTQRVIRPVPTVHIGPTPVNATNAFFNTPPPRQRLNVPRGVTSLQQNSRVRISDGHIWTTQPFVAPSEADRLARPVLASGILDTVDGTWSSVSALPLGSERQPSLFGVSVAPSTLDVIVGLNRADGPAVLLGFSNGLIRSVGRAGRLIEPTFRMTLSEASGYALHRFSNGLVGVLAGPATVPTTQATLMAFIASPQGLIPHWSRALQWDAPWTSAITPSVRPALVSEPSTGMSLLLVPTREVNAAEIPKIQVIGMHPDTGAVLWSRSLVGLTVRGPLQQLLSPTGVVVATGSPQRGFGVQDASDELIASVPALTPLTPSTLSGEPTSGKERLVLVKFRMGLPAFTGIQTADGPVAWPGGLVGLPRAETPGSFLQVRPLDGTVFASSVAPAHATWTVGRVLAEREARVGNLVQAQ